MSLTEQHHNEPRRGVYTTEFWLSIAGIAGGIALALFGPSDAIRLAGVALVTGGVGTYNVSRGNAKKAPSQG